MQCGREDSRFEFTGTELTLRAGGLVRCIDFSSGAPRTQEISLDGVVLAGANAGPDIFFPGLEVREDPAFRPEIVRVEKVPAPAYDGAGAFFEIETFEEARQIRRLYRYILYPGLSLTGVEVELTSAVLPLGILTPRMDAEAGMVPAAVLDRITPLSPGKVRSTEFRMRTDYSNDLVRVHSLDGDGVLSGNILEFRSGNTGMVMFQEAPPANERQELFSFDFQIREGSVCSCGMGFTVQDVKPGKTLVSHRQWTGAAQDTASLVRQFYLERIPANFRERYAVTVNPWGSGQFYDRVCTEFLCREIACAGKCKADVYQVDDGYQAGGFLRDLAVDNRPAGRSFWEVDPEKLPGGLAMLQKAAQDADVDLSLWFAPGMNKGFADWEESAEILLDFHRKYGIDVFKLDGVIFSSHEAEMNFVRLLRKLFTGSGGKIMANLDVTNGLRGGVGYLTGFGSIFLENRYVCHQWVHVPYHPVDTLRNLWHLSCYIPTRNLQIEAPSIAEVVPEVYQKEGRPASPEEYDFKFWLGVTLFAQPLLWFQPSMQPEKILEDTAEIMAVHRKYREKIFAGQVRPVGVEPGKEGLTGFCAETGYAIVYRTLNAPGSMQILPENGGAELLYATGPAELHSDGTAVLSDPGTFALWKIR
ncbi:MAG: hypothetical protein IJC34_04595 [Lentisphaeria bacterium]|nr:hypothetical protein [Lentisphaeria bacterium]